MSLKHLLFQAAAREKVLRGAEALTNTIRVTLGPRSKCVLIGKKWSRPIVFLVHGLWTHDWWLIIGSIVLSLLGHSYSWFWKP